jgi:hypothetical protein
MIYHVSFLTIERVLRVAATAADHQNQTRAQLYMARLIRSSSTASGHDHHLVNPITSEHF